MGKINLLSKNISELIAAGEVIERPASIVKELLENSIDAMSSSITVEIKRGGISYIRITDNGSGMSSEDAATAFLRHATSKILIEDDLDNIVTLGFRGEALASIAAVCKVEMTSKTAEMQFGTKVTLLMGEVTNSGEVGCPTGTTIIVRDLFYNVPARLKFLKKDVSEGNSISAIVDKIALSHPEISFRLISDDKLKLLTPGDSNLLSSIHSVLGREISSSLIRVDYEINGIYVSGYTSKCDASRANRTMQHFFVNERYVKSKTCMVALEESYKNSIMAGKFPFCVININVPPNSIDVNVHPAKIEVRFVNERVIFDAIYFAVKSAISGDDILKATAIPQNNVQIRNLLSTFSGEESEQTKITPLNNIIKSDDLRYNIHNYHQDKKPTHSISSSEVDYNLEKKDDETEAFSYITKKNLIKTKDDVIVDSDTGEVVILKKEKATEIPNFNIIGELFKTYLLFESEENFLLLDKHAAHERIIFNKLKRSVATDEKQVLIAPLVLTVSREEKQAVILNADIMNKLGFVFEDFGENSVIIREIPLVLSKYNITDIFLDITQKMLENKRDVTSDIFENLLHSIACRSAVKANDISSIEDLTSLLKTVYADDEIRHCPHGRPVIIAMTKSEIEKKFGRI